MWFKISHKFALRDFAVLWNAHQVNEEASVGDFGVAYYLEEASKFIAQGNFVKWAKGWVLYEVLVLYLFYRCWMKDIIHHWLVGPMSFTKSYCLM